MDLFIERIMGLEPISPVWKTETLTIVLYPRILHQFPKFVRCPELCYFDNSVLIGNYGQNDAMLFCLQTSSDPRPGLEPGVVDYKSTGLPLTDPGLYY